MTGKDPKSYYICRTKIINEYSNVEAPWGADIVGRAWGNRGNARSRQGKLQDALRDYNKAIELCPWSVDPLLNRGAVLEQLGRCDTYQLGHTLFR